MKRTWNPKKYKRMKKHGFLKRLKSLSGVKMLKRRRSKGRKRLAVIRKK